MQRFFGSLPKFIDQIYEPSLGATFGASLVQTSTLSPSHYLLTTILGILVNNNNNLIESFYSWYRGAIRHPKWRWAVIFGTALYLISPIDISPDIIPIIGWLDDGILATLLVTELSSLAMDYLKKNKDGEATVAEANGVIDVDAEVG